MKPVVRIFSASKHEDRNHLGDEVTDFLRTPGLRDVEIRTMQSSDEAYHCVTVVVIGQVP